MRRKNLPHRLKGVLRSTGLGDYFPCVLPGKYRHSKNMLVFINSKDDDARCDFLCEDTYPAKGEDGITYLPCQFESKGKWGYVDLLSGKLLVLLVWDFIDVYYGQGVARVHKLAGRARQMRRAAKLSGNDKFTIWYEGYQFVGVGKQGYVDIHGKIVVPTKYDEILEKEPRSCRLGDEDSFGTVMRQGHKWGYIQVKPVYKELIPAEYEYEELGDILKGYGYDSDAFSEAAINRMKKRENMKRIVEDF